LRAADRVDVSRHLPALGAASVVFFIAFLLRIANYPSAFINGVPQFSPFDDLYHAKRIAYSATHPFRVLSFDPNRGPNGSFCPWPPLYDMLAGAAARALGGGTSVEALARAAWFPPLVASLVAAAIAAWMTRRFGFATGLLAGAGVALSVYFLDKSRLSAIDHHFLEFPLTLGIIAAVAAVARARETRSALRAGGMLALALSCALFVQPALILAAGAALFGILLLERSARVPRAAAGLGFALTSALLFLYRARQPPGYPDSEWYLGAPYAAVLFGAAAACAADLWLLQKGASLPAAGVLAVVIGMLTIGAVPSAVGALAGGSQFFAGHPWFRSISEFQPLFSRTESVWILDLCLLGGGALLTVPMLASPRWRRGRRRLFLLFAIAYLAAAISSMRFLAVAAPLLALSGAVVFSDLEKASSRHLARAAAGLLIVPSLLSIPRASRPTPTIKPEGLPMVHAATALAQSAVPGKVLARGLWGHLLNVVADRAVLLDNFGIFGGRPEFEEATGITLATRERAVADYCAAHGVRFVVLENPLAYVPVAAEMSGLPRSAFERPASSSRNPSPTRLARSTFWWRAYFEGGRERSDLGPVGAAFQSFRLVEVETDPAPAARQYAVQIWEHLKSRASAHRSRASGSSDRPRAFE
jgi:asparagine N-glycosylation enzyme membrane subunit Stt3